MDSAWPGARPGQLEISDDGQFVIYQANRGDGWKLYRHYLGQPEGRVIPGLGNVPYFGHVSPNGQWLSFGQKGWIWKVPIDGGEPMKLWGSNNFKAWETDETFIIGRGANGLSRVPADGSMTREDIAPLDQTTGATSYGRPSMLPGGKAALVSVGYGTGVSERHIGIVSLEDGRLTTIPERGAINPRYSASGHILYTVDNVLKAIPFDLDRLEATGPAATIVEGVHVYSNSASQFDISDNGVLVYIEGPYEVGRTWLRHPLWVNRDGTEQLFNTAEHHYGIIKLSPSRRYVAAEGSTGATLYVYDGVTGTWSQFASGVGTASPVWSADSSTVFYSRNRAFGAQPADGSGEWRELVPADADHGFWGFSLSADGTRVLGTTFDRSNPAVWALASVPTTGSSGPEPLLGPSTMTRRNPTLSQDGQWLAYVEKDGILDHVYVEPYPAGGDRVLVSPADVDAAEPVWGRGMELFYRDGANMVSARLEASPSLRVVETMPLFSIRYYTNYLNTFAANYDYDPATDRFLVSKWSSPDLPGTDIQVIENGFELLNRLAPPAGGR